MKRNHDIFSEELYMTGTDRFSAASAFHAIENNTKTIRVDLSQFSFISILNKNTGAYCNGEETWNIGNNTISMNVKTVDTSLIGDQEETLLVNSCLESNRVNGEEEDVYFMAPFMYRQILKYACLNAAQPGFMRDYAAAKFCGGLMKEKKLYMRYRMDGNRKKAMIVYVEKKAAKELFFDEVLSAVRGVNCGSADRYEIRQWEITQRSRSVLFANSADSFKITWTDADFQKITIEHHGACIKTEPDLFRQDLLAAMRQRSEKVYHVRIPAKQKVMKKEDKLMTA